MVTPIHYYISLEKESLSNEDIAHLEFLCNRCRTDIILSTTLAGSGHPGGSLSSLPFLLVAYSVLNHNPSFPEDPLRDRIIISHGHISPGVYAVLAELGYFPAEEMILNFRRTGSRYAGHVERGVPGVEWGTGNLGQGLSAGAGFSLAAKLKGLSYRVLVCMGDGEQQKGQISEARRFAVKFGLNNLFAFVDLNGLQIGGSTTDIMPQNIAQNYRSDGWNVIEFDGLKFEEIYRAIKKALLHDVPDPSKPTVLIGRTIMGYGISFMENKAHYHGSALTPEEAKTAMAELGMDIQLDTLIKKIPKQVDRIPHFPRANIKVSIDPGTSREYGVDVKTDNRSAYGNALEDMAKLNNKDEIKILGLTCDLEGSVKMSGFKKVNPKSFIEGGIQEHNTATIAGALSHEEFVVFFSTFGVFGVGETYNQLRLNNLNETHLKLVCTHVGLNVGEDGPTHQCIDYISLISNLLHFKIFIPADPNQTDRIIRTIATSSGNDFVPMGRAKAPVIKDEKGKPFFGGDYKFVPGKADWIRHGRHGTFIVYGPMVEVALLARDILGKKGKDIGVLNMASIKPLDTNAILEASKIGPIVTAEDHLVNSGLGILVADTLASSLLSVPFKKIGVSHYSSSGPTNELYKEQGLSPEGLAETMSTLL